MIVSGDSIKEPGVICRVAGVRSMVVPEAEDGVQLIIFASGLKPHWLNHAFAPISAHNDRTALDFMNQSSA